MKLASLKWNPKLMLGFMSFIFFVNFVPYLCPSALSRENTTQKNDSPSSEKHLWNYKRKHFNLYSIGSEIKMGEQIQNQQIKIFRKKNIRVNPPEFAATKKRIEEIVKKIAAVSDAPYLPYEINIYDNPKIINAYCLPGGKIGIYTGLFDPENGLITINNDDEIAAVLSHEMAHAALRHITRKMTTYNSLSIVSGLVTLGTSQGIGGQWGSIATDLIDLGAGLYAPAYSRKYENEADQAGMYYMVKAGFNPQAAIDVWERASDQKKKKNKRDKTSFFDSHPSNGSRAERLRRFLPDIEEIKKQNKLVESMKR